MGTIWDLYIKPDSEKQALGFLIYQWPEEEDYKK